MQTSGVSGTQTAFTQAAAGTTKIMDRDAFLKLLITQLQHQDPMNPMKDQDFIAQLAQFSSLEQMQKMNEGFDSVGDSAHAQQAFAMAGKWVDYVDPASGQAIRGKIDSVSFEDGQPLLNIGPNVVDMSYVLKIYPDIESFGRSRSAAQAFSLIGKTIDYIGPSGETLTGKVDSASLVDGWPVLNIGSEQVDLEKVIRIHDASGGMDDDEIAAMASAMVGRRVDYRTDDQQHSGVVSGVSVVNGRAQLQVGLDLVDVSDVVNVY